MAYVAGRPIWCLTCGEYMAPGGHGIHEVRYGTGPLVLTSPDPVGGLSAVVIAVLVAVGSAALLFGAVVLQRSIYVRDHATRYSR